MSDTTPREEQTELKFTGPLPPVVRSMIGFITPFSTPPEEETEPVPEKRVLFRRAVYIASKVVGLKVNAMYVQTYHAVSKAIGHHPVSMKLREGYPTYLDAMDHLGDAAYEAGFEYLAGVIENGELPD